MLMPNLQHGHELLFLVDSKEHPPPNARFPWAKEHLADLMLWQPFSVLWSEAV